jgi:hypothetical protein
MTLGQFQAMIDAAKQQAESTGEVDVLHKDFMLQTRQPLGDARIDGITFVPSDDGSTPRFVMAVTQIYP